MARRAERPERAASKPPLKPRLDIDRTWLIRIALLVVIAIALVVVAKVSIMAFSGPGKRLERFEQRAPDTVPSKPAAGAASPQR